MVLGACVGKDSVVTAAGIKDVTSTTGVVKLRVIFINTAVACLNKILIAMLVLNHLVWLVMSFDLAAVYITCY